MKNKKVSIIIPTYNEKENIKELISRLKKLKLNYKVIFVDDSTDETPILIKKYGKGIDFDLIKGDRKGLANAIIKGIENAKTEYVCVMDADLQHPPEKILEMVSLLNYYDLVIASRFVNGSKVNFPFYRKIISKFAIFLMHLFIEKTRGIKDPSSGFFCFKKSKYKKPTIKQKGFKILVDMLNTCKFKKIKEIPFEFGKRKRGKSKLGIKEFFYFLKQIFFYGKHIKYFFKFLLVGLSGVFVNEFLLWFFTEKLGLFYIFSGMIAIEVSILWNFVLNYFFTFKAKNKFFVRMLKDNLVRLVGLFINLTTLAVLTEIFKINYLLSNLFGIAIAALFNYFINVFWVFRK